MAIEHAHPGQPVDVTPYGARLAQERSRALFKAGGLEVMRLVLLAGQTMPTHQVPGEITIHCLEGAVEVTGNGHAQTLRAGQLMYLPGGAPHGLLGIEDASVLVTIALSA